jgi:hypothetical protein
MEPEPPNTTAGVGEAANPGGMIEQIKKDYREAPSIYVLHLVGVSVGIASLVLEVTAPIIHGLSTGTGISTPVGPPYVPKPGLAGLDFVVKMCALVLVQWTIGRVQTTIDMQLGRYAEGRHGSLFFLTTLLLSLIAAWLSVLNIVWIYDSSGVSSWTNGQPNGHAFMVLLAIATSLVVHIFVLNTEYEKAGVDDLKTLGRILIWIVAFLAAGIAVWTT